MFILRLFYVGIFLLFHHSCTKLNIQIFLFYEHELKLKYWICFLNELAFWKYVLGLLNQSNTWKLYVKNKLRISLQAEVHRGL